MTAQRSNFTEKNMKVLFITEGNKNIGMGALYDCVILAKRFREKFNPKIKFLISHDSDSGAEGFLLNGYNIERVNITDTKYFLNTIKKFKPDIVVRDLLNLKEDFVDGLGKFKAAVIDVSHKSDFKGRLKADIVINLLYHSKDVKCLYGPRHAILDSKFKNLRKKKIKNIAKNLLVSFGGSDVNNLTLKLMKVLDKLGLASRVNVVIGPGFGSERKIDKLLRRMTNPKRFIINRKVADMLSLMLDSDLAFVSGGRTICELAATGTPGVVFAQNELEYGRLKEFQKWKSVITYGYFSNDEEKLASDIKNIILNKSLRERMSRKGQKTVDGEGVDRIIDAVLEIRNEKN
ncbi:MAG: glycosyltransferase [Candidatus Omnitrophota bacterium]